MRSRALAWTVDAGLTAAPVVLGWLVVDSLRDANGGGQADRWIFGAVALVTAVALAVWNLGLRVGGTGQSTGMRWAGVLARDTGTLGPIGRDRALLRALRRDGIEVVREKTARAEGFTPHEPDGAPAAVRRRRLLGLLALLAILVFAVVASVAIGARPLTIAEVAHGVFAADGSQTDVIVQTLRGPRTLLALVVGAALGVAGALIQGFTRNPLADAGLLGLNAGAAFLVVLSMYLFSFTAPSQYLWFAFAGAFFASIVVFGLSSIGGGGGSPLGLALAGAAVAFSLQALTQAIIVLDQNSLDSYRFWVVGSVAGRGLDIFWTVLPFIVVGLLLALAGTPGLNLLGLGDDVARSLGSNIVFSRIVGVVAITLLTGAATAACGPIAFIGLVVPHIARAITGPDYRWLVPYSALLGSALLLVADVLGRVLVRPGELQVGIVLALIGGPFFVALVRRRKLVSL
ncbi:iron ABC transporter permease [Rhodococcus rhodnii]|uniref:Iron ABC transporter permease n=2 Tax=Rhodococcus rhodnii TaxID=38312 RepID=A0A6P2CIP9_9NOCA|nr:iron ABC transporter permease [Rhodococcus rhodnii]TXG92707.1 iron ABC transporter permease [Rhodococcus rhodnii]